ncbi:MAG: helix-turn-helix transcriptional regulator [Fretibacterium sp.]|nr:helix-turn-helix transcriptional regulator [Fretibacterium sp.]
MPGKNLARYVDAYWFHRETSGGRAFSVLPDGCMDLIFDRSEGRALVCGTMTRSREVRRAPGGALFGIRFLPGVLPPLLGESADRFRDGTAELGAVSIRLADRFAPLHDLSSVEEMSAFCDSALEEVLRRGPVDDRILLRLSVPSCSVTRLSSEAGLSVRQLERLFARYVGVPPKLFLKILRFRCLREELERLDEPLARLSQKLGYADQSHMIREYRQLHPKGERMSRLYKTPGARSATLSDIPLRGERKGGDNDESIEEAHPQSDGEGCPEIRGVLRRCPGV